MKVDKLYVAGTGVWLPPTVSVADAVADGLLPPDRFDRDRLVSVGVAGAEPPPVLAVGAAGQALSRAGIAAERVDLVLHASVYHQGLDMWAVASYIQREVLGNHCPAFEVRQMSNGGMAALELAASYLLANPARSAALLTTADKFCPPVVNRWATETGMVFGDGGSSLVLSTEDGFARLRGVATTGDGSLEAMHRGDDPFTESPLAGTVPIDLNARARAFIGRNGLGHCLRRLAAGQDAAMDRALADADAKLGDIDWFVLPHFGFARLQASYFRRLSIDPNRTTWPWSRTVGHLGAGDQFAGLDWLATTGALRPGQLCLLSGIGSGFTFSAAVLEVLCVPVWASGAHEPTSNRTGEPDPLLPRSRDR